jgi:hypothetical protein
LSIGDATPVASVDLVTLLRSRGARGGGPPVDRSLERTAAGEHRGIWGICLDAKLNVANCAFFSREAQSYLKQRVVTRQSFPRWRIIRDSGRRHVTHGGGALTRIARPAERLKIWLVVGTAVNHGLDVVHREVALRATREAAIPVALEYSPSEVLIVRQVRANGVSRRVTARVQTLGVPRLRRFFQRLDVGVGRVPLGQKLDVGNCAGLESWRAAAGRTPRPALVPYVERRDAAAVEAPHYIVWCCSVR